MEAVLAEETGQLQPASAAANEMAPLRAAGKRADKKKRSATQPNTTTVSALDGANGTPKRRKGNDQSPLPFKRPK